MPERRSIAVLVVHIRVYAPGRVNDGLQSVKRVVDITRSDCRATDHCCERSAVAGAVISIPELATVGIYQAQESITLVVLIRGHPTKIPGGLTLACWRIGKARDNHSADVTRHEPSGTVIRICDSLPA